MGVHALKSEIPEGQSLLDFGRLFWVIRPFEIILFFFIGTILLISQRGVCLAHYILIDSSTVICWTSLFVI